jgi:hypothetical protein
MLEHGGMPPLLGGMLNDTLADLATFTLCCDSHFYQPAIYFPNLVKPLPSPCVPLSKHRISSCLALQAKGSTAMCDVEVCMASTSFPDASLCLALSLWPVMHWWCDNTCHRGVHTGSKTP